MSWKLVEKLPRNLRNVAFDVDFDSITLIRIILVFMLALHFSEPARLNEPHPAIIAKDSRYECFHFLRGGNCSFHVSLKHYEYSVLLVDLCSELARIVVVGVDWPELMSDTNWPIEFSFNLTDFNVDLLALHLC